MFELTGLWTDGNINPDGPPFSDRPTAYISVLPREPGVTPRSVTIDMSNFHRPTAHGNMNFDRDLTVTFPDDRTHIGIFENATTILWDNKSRWLKQLWLWPGSVLAAAIDLNGYWTDGSSKSALISETKPPPDSPNPTFTIDMSAFGRPTATGTIDFIGLEIGVFFPDDRGYNGKPRPANPPLTSAPTIEWSTDDPTEGHSIWTKLVE